MIGDPSAVSQVECSSSVKDDVESSIRKETNERTGGEQDTVDVALSTSLGTVSTETDRQEPAEVCRVCQCADPDKTGEAALKALHISLPLHAIHRNTSRVAESICEKKSEGGKDKSKADGIEDEHSTAPAVDTEDDLEAGSADTLIKLGCACRNDLALAHYACALRWFVSKGSMVCEICGAPALNIRISDRDKVSTFLKERESLQGQHRITSTGQMVYNVSITEQSATHITSTSSGESSEALAWFDLHGNTSSGLQRIETEQPVNVPDEGILNSVSPAAKWAVEGTGILIATGLLTVTITWLIAPRVNKGIARKGLNILLGGLCALSIVVFLRFGVLPRIKYGPARYWAILVVFWFLVFGVWASSTRNTRPNS